MSEASLDGSEGDVSYFLACGHFPAGLPKPLFLEDFMFGLVSSLLSSAASGISGMFGQSSANDAMMQMAGNRYQLAVKDMNKAGLNPAMMFGSGGPAPMAPIQNEMTAPSAALKDAASSAVQMNIAQKTIDQLVEQIAKTNAEAAQVKASTPGIAARGALDVMKSDAVQKIPEAIRVPIYQGGFGADTMSSAGRLASGAGAAAAVGSGVASRYIPSVRISPPSFSSAAGAVRELKRRYESLPSYSEAEREAARIRNAKRWGWLTGNSARGSFQYQQ